MSAATITPAKFRDVHTGTVVEAMQVNTDDDVRAVRYWWLESGTAAVLTYPTAPPVLFVGNDRPLADVGTQVRRGDYVVLGPAGDVEVESPATFAARYKPEES